MTKADDDLGTIMAAARQHLDPANTYTFFTSDHGGQWPFGKWNLYDAGIRVPLIVAGPGIKAGGATDAMVSWVDLLPTLVELAGGKPPADIDGRSFAAVLRGEQTKHRDEIFTTHSGDGRLNVYPIRAVRDGRWKYILNLHPEYQHATHINRAASGDGLSYFRSWEDAAKTDPKAAAVVAPLQGAARRGAVRPVGRSARAAQPGRRSAARCPPCHHARQARGLDERAGRQAHGLQRAAARRAGGNAHRPRGRREEESGEGQMNQTPALPTLSVKSPASPSESRKPEMSKARNGAERPFSITACFSFGFPGFRVFAFRLLPAIRLMQASRFRSSAVR